MVLADVATELLVRLAVGVLGILAPVGFNPWVLTLVATLCLGGSILPGSAALHQNSVSNPAVLKWWSLVNACLIFIRRITANETRSTIPA